MKTIHTEITIDASTVTVWQVLMNFSRFSEWNSFIKQIEGEAKPGKKLKVKLETADGKAMNFNPVVKTIRPEQQFCWQGSLIVPGLFDGEHSFELESITPSKTRFVHRETFKGLLVPFLSKVLNATGKSFEQMNQDLKQRSENH